MRYGNFLERERNFDSKTGKKGMKVGRWEVGGEIGVGIAMRE